MSDHRDRKQMFFYAQSDAKYYDTVEELAQPCIDLIHDTMIDLIEYSQSENSIQNSDERLLILDIGSGTGAEAFRLIERFESIHIVAVDFSSEINQEFRRKFADKYPNQLFESKITLLEEDFFAEVCEPQNMCSRIASLSSRNGFDAVVAGFLLHHYNTDLKQQFYQRIYDSLKPGGVLVHGDLFAYQSASLSSFSHDIGEKWISKQLSSPDGHLRTKFEKLGSDAERLRKEWIHHWNHCHVYHPAEKSNAGSDTHDECQDTSHEEMVLQAGFGQLGFPFRLWEAGVLWARR